MNLTSKFVWGLWLLTIVTPGPAYAADRWQVGSAPSFSSGKYGTDGKTDVVHTPFSARRLFTNGDVTLVFPFTCISGNGLVTVVDGTPVRNQRLAASGTAGRTGRSGNSTTSTSPITSTTGPATNCGMGDIVVRGRYYLVDERGWLPTVALRAHVKTPTASANRGLGTGKPDEGAGVEVSRTISSTLMLMADGGYTFIGKPDDVDYNNNWWYDIGVGRDLRGGSLNVSVFFEEERAILPGFENARDVLATVTVKASAGWRFQAAGQFGLNDGAPAVGITLGASRRF